MLIPAVAALFAAVWARWAARKRVTHDGASLAGYERFRAAMEAVPDAAGRPVADGSAAPEGASAGGVRDTRPAGARAGAEQPAAEGGRIGRRRRIIVSGHGPARSHSGRKASAKAASGAGEEDSPKRPVEGSIP
ncbi:hypothetical protein [Actinacidiphila rubida]|uniref:hypothetical protein n=1 Tax=Actinacidiphila rubida TaxID=310780 RepID=UPI0015A4FEB3|nr:hypothetical protein [Actinacidiphila rubida]